MWIGIRRGSVCLHPVSVTVTPAASSGSSSRTSGVRVLYVARVTWGAAGWFTLYPCRTINRNDPHGANGALRQEKCAQESLITRIIP